MDQQKTGQQNMESLSFYEYCEKHHKEQILNAWDAKRNLPCRPQAIPWDYGRPVFWMCENGHRWRSKPEVTIRKNGRCPICSCFKLHVGVNDLQTLHPGLAEEWNEERNAPVTPNRVLPNSKAKYWWNCPNGHIWEASAWERTQDVSCPYCSGEDLSRKKPPFPLAYPKLYAQWDVERNTEISPWRVKERSLASVGWICDVCGTRWEASIYSRTNGKNDCPECERKKRWRMQHEDD